MEQIISQAAHLVYNQLGYGLAESCYRKALASELRITPTSQSVTEEQGIPLYFNTSAGDRIQITVLRADIVLTIGGHRVVLELKTLSKELTAESKEYAQVTRYAQLLNIRYKYLINFSKHSVQIL